MSRSSTAPEIPADADVARAWKLQARAVEQNASGHAARGERLVLGGLTLLRVPEKHDPEACQADRCLATTRLLATLAKSTVEIRGVDPALEIMDRAQTWAACLGDRE